MQSVSPVFTDEDARFEYEIAKDQPQYEPVIGLPVTLEVIDPETKEVKRIDNWAIALRFQLSEEERAAVAAGQDLVVTQLVFGKLLNPMNLQFCKQGEKPVLMSAEQANSIELECKEHGLKFGPATPGNLLNYRRHMFVDHERGKLQIMPAPPQLGAPAPDPTEPKAPAALTQADGQGAD